MWYLSVFAPDYVHFSFGGGPTIFPLGVTDINLIEKARVKALEIWRKQVFPKIIYAGVDPIDRFNKETAVLSLVWLETKTEKLPNQYFQQ